jgi:DNA helicase IV
MAAWEPKENWFINESELDDEQYDVKRLSAETSYVIKGCAGSGKTILALWRAVELTQQGQDALVIVYTGALKLFIQAALKHNPLEKGMTVQVLSEYAWRKDGKPVKAHLIIDEAQDFTVDEISEFRKSATVSIALFGDSAQKLYVNKPIYDENDEEIGTALTLTVEEIAEHLGLPIRSLKKNHRLPKKVARFAQHLSSSSESLEMQCQKEGERLPNIVRCLSGDNEIDHIIQVIKSRGLRDVGILLPNNDMVEAVYNAITSKGMLCEFRKRKGNNRDTKMDFASDNPKVMTYHSAKGLQFQTVFLPYCSKFNTKIWQKPPLYVACTRASQQLVVTYTNEPHEFFAAIPNEIYEFSNYVPRPATS